MKEKINTVVFDIGNVLAGFDWQSYLSQFGFSKEIESRIAKATFLSDNWKEVDRSVKPDKEIYADCLKEVPDLEQELLKVWAGRATIVKEYEYATEWILSLKRKGISVYLLSNYGKTPFEAAKKTFSFFQHVDGMVISYEVKHIKPEPEIYQELIRRFQIVPKETVFIDDIRENLKAAEEFGIGTILFTSKEEVQKHLDFMI